MQIALLGHGERGHALASAIAATPGMEPGPVATREWRSAIETPGLDAVVIALPVDLHFAAAKAALEAGLDVLVERPLATTPAECEALILLAQDSGRTLLPGHAWRLSHQWGRMRRLIAEGAIGGVLAVTLDVWRGAWPAGSEGWRRDPERAGSRLLEGAVLGFDLASWWMRESGDARWVYGRGSRLPSTRAGLWDNVTAVVEFEAGSHATLTESLAVAGRHVAARVVGEKGALLATWDSDEESGPEARGVLKLWDGERLGEIGIEAAGEDVELREQLAHFAAVCRGEAEPVVTASEAARAVALCAAAERSLRSGEAEAV